MNDVVLRYRATPSAPDTAPARAPEPLRARVAQRLGAAEVSAEIDAAPSGELSLRVDEDFADEVGQLLRWRGGLAIAVVDDSVPVPLEEAATRADVTHALAGTPDPAGHRLAMEPVREAARSDRARARALVWPPVALVETENVAADGTRLLVPITREVEASLATLATEQPSAALAIVRDRTVLAVVAPGELVRAHELVVPLGTSVLAYTEAADLVRLLATPMLPPLEELSRAPVPPDVLLAAANLALPFAVSFAWLFFVRRFDRAQPEPMWLVILTFVLGAVAVIPAGLVEWGWDTLSPYTNPTLLTFGHSLRAFPVALLGFVVTVGLSEEGAKLLATWSLATHRREFDEPVDGIVYGAAAALGFAAAENIRYLALGRVAGALVASRAFMSVPAHLFFGTIWGYALGRRLVEPGRRVWPLLLAAAALHGLFDTCLSIDGLGAWSLVVELAAASIFVVHLRLALRHGAITPRVAPSLSARGEPELFRMGSRRAFAAFVVAMYLLSGAIFLLTLFDHSGRAGIAFGVASTVALALLGWAARGVAATLPLDAVVDDGGVTFAGASIRYGDVLRIERRRLAGSPRRHEQMLIFGTTRRLTLGPASHETLDALSHAIAMRLSSAALRS